ncbi:protein phosphatase 1 regulatory subunit 12A isoform X3 [Bactrocera oleae]|uniref:protein phosphatase 1 regulatory subunit 12A isoform X3 n=1 Tax=Bactrocera oleae TaxID=104688 RepID=UPI00387EAB5F
MSSLDVRNNSAVMKRAEQLKRWEESDTNRQPPTPRPERGRKIKFSSGCVFLAACMSGDKEEVLKLLESGADINTANVDGLTALHQACIDDNLEMVEFLIEHGADINRQDNEGWTPLHATASCGFVSIARYLVEHGADPAAVNSDGDLAVDLAVDIQHLAMMDFMQKVMTEHNIDCEKARQAEEQLMLSDAKKWLRSDASEVDRPHPKTGATALHVAAAKGYTKVISLLLAGRANVDKQDNDGWTPLHAASHWGQKEAADMLVNAMADMDIRNYAGQTCIDVADRKMAKFLEELRSTSNKRIKRRPSSQIRISDKIENHIDNTPTKIIRVEVKSDQSKDQANASINENELPMIDSSDQLEPHNLARIAEYDETDSELTDSTESSHSTSLSEPEDEKSKQSHETVKPSAVATTDNQTVEDEAPWRRNSLARARTQNESPTKIQVPEKDVSKTNNTTETSDVILRRTQSFEHDEKFYQKYHELRARIKANSCPILPAKQQQLNNSNNSSNSNSQNNNSNSSNSNNNINNNSNNSNNINNSKSNINTNIINNPTSALGNVYTPIPNYSVQRSASLKDHRNYRTISTNTSSTSITTAYTTSTPTTADSTTSITTTGSTTTTTPSTATTTTPIRSAQNSGKGATSATSTNSNNKNNNNNDNNTNVNNTITANNNNNNNNNNSDTKQPTSSTPDAAAPTTTVAAKQKMSAGTIFKNFFKSFVPPVRDEESETQRKAHAKRVRETRRSTQGVTLDEIKSAEELVKKKNSNMNNNNNSSSNETQVATTTAATIPTTSEQQQQQEVEAIEPPHTEPSVAATQTLPPTASPQASQRQTADGDETPVAEQQADCTSAEESDKEEEEEKECDQQDDESAVDNDGEDVSASFTIVAPTRKNSSTKATMLDDTTTDDATTTDDNDEEVSATYTLTPRHSFVGSAAPTETVETTIVVTPPELIINESDVDSETVRKKFVTDEIEYENVPESANKPAIDDDIENENEDESSESEQQNEEATEIENLSKAEDEQTELEADNEEEVNEEKAVDAEEDVESEDSETFEINEFENEKTENSATKELATDEISAPKSHISTANNSADTSITQTERARLNTLIPLPLVDVASSSVAHATNATPTTPTSTSANTPTLDSPVRLREKRIPYEPDSNNALTLAERLRYEASKYSAVGDSDESSSSSTVASKTRSLPPASLASDAVDINELSTNYGKISLSSRRSLDSSSLSLHGQNESQATQATSNEINTIQSAIGSISSCSGSSGTAFVATTTTATAPSSSNSSNSSTMAERRPSWRLKFDAGCKFKLEDASSGNTFPPNNSTIIPSAPAVIAAANLSSTISQRRINSNSLNSSNQSLNSIGRPVSAPVNATTSTTLLSNDTHNEGVSIFGRRLTGGSSATTPTTTTSTAFTTTANVTAATAISTSKTNDDKDNDKENDNRNLAAQSAIQRRRKPKRRSTGVVHIDMDELDPERQDSANDAEEKEKEKESGGERGASRSRLSSTTNANTNANSTTDENKARDRSENGEAIDYKALWEAVKLENDKLKQQLKKKDDEIVQSRATLERFTNALLQKLKTENERLRAENRALTRVVSKLTTSAQSQLAKKSK